jgi:chromosomal replication initiation ATPase DnaA
MNGAGGRQLVLDLPLRTALGREDFMVTPSNAAAVAMIDRFPEWPTHAAVIVGDAGSGKSHLMEVWRQLSGARHILASQLHRESPDDLLAAGALAVDDAPGEQLDERALFHVLNLAKQSGSHVLLASCLDPASWPVSLPDLASRLRALPVARLDPPDDALLRGVVVKLFSDRQLVVDETVISYLLLRMPRSLEAARLLVARVDELALSEKVAVGRGLVARVLEMFGSQAALTEDG